MSTKRARQGAFTLVELMVATGLATLVGGVVVFLSMFTSRSFVAMDNYMDMEIGSQLALDKMCKLIRQARQVTAFTTNSVSLVDASGNPLQFNYNASAKTLTVVSSGQTNLYLTTCDSLQFWIYQHTPISNSFDCYAPAYVTNARLIQVTWSRSRPVVGTSINTETVESAEVALRNH